MIVREATAADAAGIAKVHIDTWRSTYRGIVSDEVLDGLSYDEREATRRKEMEIGQDTLIEVAYEWERLNTLTA